MATDAQKMKEDRVAILAAADRATRLAAGPADDHLLLRLRLALNLPRLCRDELQDDGIILDEARRLLNRIRIDQADFDWRVRPQLTSLSHLELIQLSHATARTIHERFHYIGFCRDGLHLGLVPPDWVEGQPPAVLLTLSPLDLPHLDSLLSSPARTLVTQVLSRSFSFRWAPKNAFSYAHGKLTRFLAGELDVLLSYVNPNVGFSGASYLAAGWRDLGSERSPAYFYLDRDYCTRRHLADQFGSWDPTAAPSEVQRRIERSRVRLAPLRLLAAGFTHEARQWLKSQEPLGLPHLS